MNKKFFCVILAAALATGIMSGCSDDEDDSALPSVESIIAETEAATAATAAKTSAADKNMPEAAENNEETNEDTNESKTQRAYEQAEILENYFLNTVSTMTGIEGYNAVDPKAACLGIYDFRCDGSCEMLVRFEWGSELEYGWIINGYTVNSDGAVSEELLCDADEIGSMQGSLSQEYSVWYNTADGMYYKCDTYATPLGTGTTYTRDFDGAEFSHGYYFDGRAIYSINNIYTNLTEESFHSALDGITGTMTEPVPTRSDGGINIYLPDYDSAVPADLDPLKYPLQVNAPTYVKCSIDGSEATLSWEGRGNLYYIYSVENGSYVKIGETSGYSYTFPAADYSAVCVTEVPEYENMRESQYSEIVYIDYKDYSGYAALDFIDMSGAGVMDYAGDFEQHGWNPYYGDEFISPTFPDYTFYNLESGNVRTVSVNKGGLIADGVRYDENVLENIRDGLGAETCRIETSWSDGDLHGLTVVIKIDEFRTILLSYKAPQEDYDLYRFEDPDYQWRELERKYKDLEVSIGDVGNYVVGECRSCTVKRVTE